jgi:hypothetical protein
VSKDFRSFALFSIPMRIRTGTCNFRPVKMEKGTYFIMLNDDGRIECFVTLLQIDISSLATKRNISNTLFLGTDIYNAAQKIKIIIITINVQTMSHLVKIYGLFIALFLNSESYQTLHHQLS